jgi:hypothetical protein
MRRERAMWIIIVAAIVVASGIAGGCSTILGIQDVPKPADGGTEDAPADDGGGTGDASVCHFDDDASQFDKGCVFTK